MAPVFAVKASSSMGFRAMPVLLLAKTVKEAVLMTASSANQTLSLVQMGNAGVCQDFT